MKETKSEKRKFERYDVDSVHGKMLFSSDINILNISMDGAAIATTQRLTLDRVYSLKLKFNENTLIMKGKVVWSVLSHSRTMKNGEVVPVYRVGIKFINVLTDAATNLISYIEKNRKNALEQRILGVRFKVALPEGAEIDLSCEYSIKIISLSGMLIETDTPIALDTRHEMTINLDGTPVNITGKVANVAEISVNDSVRYDIGIEFADIAENDLRTLKSYIDAIGKKT